MTRRSAVQIRPPPPSSEQCPRPLPTGEPRRVGSLVERVGQSSGDIPAATASGPAPVCHRVRVRSIASFGVELTAPRTPADGMEGPMLHTPRSAHHDASEPSARVDQRSAA